MQKSKLTLDLPVAEMRRLRALQMWLRRDSRLPTGSAADIEAVALRALERGAYELEVDYWRVRSSAELVEDFAWLAEEHRHWLLAFDRWHGQRWKQMLADDPEAALWESVVRRVLQANVAYVDPGENLSTGEGPDFRCRTLNQEPFYVEAKCHTIEAATRQSGTPDSYRGGGSYGFMTDAIRNAISSKTKQAAKSPDAPTLVFLGTLHRAAGMLCMRREGAEFVLTGRTLIRVPIGRGEESRQGHDLVATLQGAGFVKPIGGGAPRYAYASRSVSGVVLVGSSALQPEFRIDRDAPLAWGVLNPRPRRAFRPTLLCHIPFCRAVETRPGEFKITWDESER